MEGWYIRQPNGHAAAEQLGKRNERLTKIARGATVSRLSHRV